ncbi:XRE family transcriptional regulator [Methylorubrum extorquens]|uniref:XRE family transcriptional regulator n=1 Tax=Methylorubrum extorquens TaxID=408 RepID=UPI001EE52488|nr:helix-turn-helix domain-containing protein [Methylorubrum extorquens]MCG5247954.1 helix-turn-helix domain-containing protein [Methylorubrum extorquens]
MSWHDIIREARKALNMSQSALAARVGVSQPLIARLEAGQIQSTEHLPKIVDALSLDHNLFPAEAFQRFHIEQVTRARPKRDLPEFAKDPAYWATAAGLIGEVPLYASAEGGDGALIIERDPIGTVRRPPELQGVKDGYAIYHVGESMVPEFEPGDTLYINPRLTALINTTCVFYNTSAEEPRAMVKRLKGETSDEWRVAQHNPPLTFSISKADWGIRHRVIARYMR